MTSIRVAFCAGLIASVFAAVQAVDATTVKQFDLPKMTSSAARVFRGTVTDVHPGKVSAGGGELATTVYRIRITETFKGQYDTYKNVRYADVEMLGSPKADVRGQGPQHFSAFRDMPKLERGKDYLLFLTAESRIALSSPVGLAQGLFDIDTTLPSEPTSNRTGNAGLLPDVKGGPLPYQELAKHVREIVSAQQGGAQ